MKKSTTQIPAPLKLEEINNEEFCAFCAPDGSIQFATVAPNFQTCIAITEVLSKSGMVKHPTVMFEEGFHILPVLISVTQNGDEEKAFKMR